MVGLPMLAVNQKNKLGAFKYILVILVTTFAFGNTYAGGIVEKVKSISEKDVITLAKKLAESKEYGIGLIKKKYPEIGLINGARVSKPYANIGSSKAQSNLGTFFISMVDVKNLKSLNFSARLGKPEIGFVEDSSLSAHVETYSLSSGKNTCRIILFVDSPNNRQDDISRISIDCYYPS